MRTSIINRVVPTNTLFFVIKDPRLCEKQTAALRNHTIDCMEDDGIGAVACRYLQNKYGEITGRNSLIFYTLALSLLVFIFLFVVLLLVRHAYSDKLSINESEQFEAEYRLIAFVPLFFC